MQTMFWDPPRSRWTTIWPASDSEPWSRAKEPASVGHRTGHAEVSQPAKHGLIHEPEAVLLITPESIESIFINQSAHLRRLFGGLRFVVIDEVHAFLGNERGMHLASLLARIRTVQIQGEPRY